MSTPSHNSQEGMGKHRQRNVAVPSGPGANLVLVEADFPLRLFEGRLDHPSGAGHTDNLFESGGLRWTPVDSGA